MAKIMVFIDGSWLYANTPRLADSLGQKGFQIDFGKLPAVLAGAVRRHLDATEVDVVRVYLFGSYASNCDPLDDVPVQRRIDFYDLLREEHHYEVEVFPINYRGRRLRKADRDPTDPFEPKEKCVDIALATSMLYFAAIPFAYDIAIAVIGDQDFKPALQLVRRLGKRVAIASIKGSCAEDIADPTDQARIKDFDVIWIDDFLEDLELKRPPHLLECQSPSHAGVRMVKTTFYPRRGQRFYCEDCRARFDRQRQEQGYGNRFGEQAGNPEKVAGETIGQVVKGQVAAINANALGPFAFMRTVAGNDYYFNPTLLEGELRWENVKEGTALQAEIVRLPANGKAGMVRKVKSFADGFENETEPDSSQQ